MVTEQPQPEPAAELTAESANAVADQVIADVVVPKKIPAVEDTDAQIKAVAGALASALLTATELPLTALGTEYAKVGKQMVALGIRQTEHIDPEAVHAPAWITDGVRQEAVVLPDPPDHTGGEPYVARTAVAPQPPKRIKKTARAVRRSGRR